ncbi:acyl-CoA dehydrogenase family protein [Nocardioides zeae]|uniref:Monooxygenase n=1 Tax=Nocardioides zeae TaxID=1457234 RepID=A0A6P0HKV0_9ACTN|nr:acyl-CoA dehydrogenase family protein [Nocardioides zeae]NEN78877.1 monooxygenase [Nocardioides zeae]
MTLDRTRRSPGLEELRARFAPVLATIAAGALERELDRRLPVEEVELLKRAGFGAVRVPREHGGAGASLAELTQLWIDLAAADNNLAQVLRGHFAFAEDRLWHHARRGGQEVWFDRFVRGQIAGNAWSEVGATAIDTQGTVLRPAGDGQFRLDGTKYYTTGTIFAEWADVYVRRGDEVGGFAIAVVETDQAGVSVHDDWNGFGQVGTGSGTAVFVDARVAASDVLPFEERFPYQTALYQLNLLATLAGIGRAALSDVVRHVRGRERTYSHANAPRVRDDAQVLARVGEIASAVYAAEAVTLRVADALDAAHEAATLGAAEAAARAEAAELESSAAQVVVTDLVLRATSDLFDALGASGTAQDKGLDRHWRNARTVASHNPRILKARVVGDAEVNGTPPPYAWAIGRTERDRADWTPRAVPVAEAVG